MLGRNTVMAVGAVIAGLVLPSQAMAQYDAVTRTDLNLRVGPGTDFGVIDVIPGGYPVDVLGCLDAYEWCDVDWDGLRGWVSARYLEHPGTSAYLPQVGPRIGVPIISFSFTTYHDRHYHDYPWYRERHGRWRGRDWRDDRRDDDRDSAEERRDDRDGRDRRETEEQQRETEQPRRRQAEEPRQERQAEPRQERQAEPRQERQAEPRQERQAEPRQERQAEPRQQRQAEPRQERQAEPRQQRERSERSEGQGQPSAGQRGQGRGRGGGSQEEQPRRGQ